MSAPYLAKLNAEQRAAVEYGGPDFAAAGPLLIIAGAGSGKTNTLAHRVAHLIVHGIDPRRILLLTFSRRAAGEMTRRVERIVAQVLGDSAGAITGALTWSGTFHAVGARLLREYAPQIGLDRTFTIHDRERLGRSDESGPPRSRLLEDREALSDERHLPGDLFARRERADAARGGAGRVLSVVRRLGSRAAPAVCGLCRGQAAPARARLRRSAALLGADDGGAGARRRRRRALRSRAGRRVSGHQPAAGFDPAGAEAERHAASRWWATTRNRSTRSGRRRCATFSIFPVQFSPRAEVRHARPQLPVDAADPRRRQCGHRAGRGALHARICGPTARRPSGRNSSACATKPTRRATSPNRFWSTAKPGSSLKAQAVLFRASHHSAPLEIELTRRNIPFVKFGGLKFLEAAHIKDVLAFLRWAENPRDRVAGFRVVQLLPGVGPATAARLLERRPRRSEYVARAIDDFRPPPRRGRALARFLRDRRPGGAAQAPAGPPSSTSSAAGMSRISSASTTTRSCARPISCSSSRSRRPIRRASAS